MPQQSRLGKILKVLLGLLILPGYSSKIISSSYSGFPELYDPDDLLNQSNSKLTEGGPDNGKP